MKTKTIAVTAVNYVALYAHVYMHACMSDQHSAIMGYMRKSYSRICSLKETWILVRHFSVVYCISYMHAFHARQTVSIFSLYN